MPSVPDRHEILVAASRKVRLEGGIDMNTLAQRTEGYTGADLQALIYNAQLDAIHSAIEDSAPVNASIRKGLVNDDVRVVEGGQPRMNMTASEMSALRARLENITQNDLQTYNPDTTRTVNAVSKAKPAITPQHLEVALTGLRPSLPPAERLRLDRIYRSFVAERSGALPNGEAASGVGARASLM